EHAGRVGNAEEEIGVAVLVDVGRGGRRVRGGGRQAHLRRDVAERAVAQVLKQRGGRAAEDEQQIDVAPVVEVRRNDGDGLVASARPSTLVASAFRRKIQSGLFGNLRERAIAVVAQQPG